MKLIALLLTLTITFLTGCATRTPPPEVKVITNTQYVVIEVPTSYLLATKPTAPTNEGCTSPVNWKDCATSRAKHIVQLLGDVGQCNADKYKTQTFLSEQTTIVNERNKKP